MGMANFEREYRAASPLGKLVAGAKRITQGPAGERITEQNELDEHYRNPWLKPYL